MANENQIKSAIEGLDDFTLTELQQELINYLRANIDEVCEALAD